MRRKKMRKITNIVNVVRTVLCGISGLYLIVCMFGYGTAISAEKMDWLVRLGLTMMIHAAFAFAAEGIKEFVWRERISCE